MEKHRFQENSYAVSGDNTLLDEINHITPDVRRLLQELQPDIENGRKYLLKKINRLCLKYPKVPVFKNILSNLYQQQGNMQQAIAVNNWLVKEHPHYLFGKVNLAAEYLHKEEYHKIPEILGKYLEIGALYPERKEFHVEEVMAFNFIVIKYFLSIDKIEDAELRVEILKDLDEDHPKALQAREDLQQWYHIKAALRKQAQQEQQITVPVKDNRSQFQTNEAPEFHFPEEMSWLYNNGLDISFDKVETLLQLERKKLIEDLEKLLLDSISRYDYFVAAAEREDVEPHELEFPHHALLLLAHLKSEGSLDQILFMLQQDSEFNDFWFGYSLSYLFENALFHCGRNVIPRLFDFLKQPNIYGQNKAIVGEALVKMIETKGDKAAYIPLYKEVLDHYLANPEDENLIDTEAIGFLISDIVDLGYIILLPQIKQLFDRELVDSFICGQYEDLEPQMEKNFQFPGGGGFYTKELQQQYHFLEEEEERHFLPFQPDNFDEMYYRQMIEDMKENSKPVTSEKKIGRNDPCPCGSGKKYKKCCMNG